MMDLDLENLKVQPSVGYCVPTKRVITRVPIRKFIRDEFAQTRPDPEWRIDVMILERKEEGATYLLAPPVWDVLPDLQRAVTLFTAIDRKGNPFFVPVPLPREDGRTNPWHESLAAVVNLSQHKWVRCIANMKAGVYDALVATGSLGEPDWPDLTFKDLFEIAFRGRVINSLDHPLIRQLLGEI